VLLFAISVTGLALTVSTLWLRGSFYASSPSSTR
jgi:hypothetical protein